MRTNRYVLGILAHVDSGKTTLAESILYKSGIIRKIGRVDHKDTFLDHYDVERTRGITVFSKQAQFCVGEKEICLLDQVYVKAEEGKQTVAQYLAQVAKENSANLSIKRFVRFETGEGLEKKSENFAAEVAAQMGM